MAAQNRATNAALIDANLPDNTTQLITPEKHREVEDALNDSAFNVLDDDAFDVPYTPTTPSSWGATVPSETGGALDILIEKLNNKASNNIAYVASASGAFMLRRNKYDRRCPGAPNSLWRHLICDSCASAWDKSSQISLS